MLAKHLMSSGAARVYVEDVFSAYTVSGSIAGITNGLDISTYGGSSHIKKRSGATKWWGFHSALTGRYGLHTNSTNARSDEGAVVWTPTATGYTLSGDGGVNEYNGTGDYVHLTYRNAPKFYTHSTKAHTNGVASTVDLSTLGTVGKVRVKQADGASGWYVWHRSLTAGKLLYGQGTNAETTDSSISVSGTTLTIAASMSTGTYLVEAWAHDTSADGLIQCGSFTTDGSGNATVTLGWEPQLVEWKGIDVVSDWVIEDSMRGYPSGPGIQYLYSNTSAAENAFNGSGSNAGGLLANGFKLGAQGSASKTYIYLAIRRGPMRFPTSGTQVYQAIARTGTGAAATVTGVGFPPDLVISTERAITIAGYKGWWDRLRGKASLRSDSTIAEVSDTGGVTSFDMSGMTLGADGTSGTVNWSGASYIHWFFRRYPGVFDEVCYTGTGVAKTEAHNLGVVPEMMIIRPRNRAGTNWAVMHSGLATTSGEYLTLNSSGAKSTGSGVFNNTAPTASVFTVGVNAETNFDTSTTYVAYLFATLAGVSKVGSYTGSGTTLQINCGFAAGARFVLIKRADAINDWYLWDSVRGIVSGNDPYLLLNSTSAEITGTDYIDPYSAGFEISSSAPSGINANGGSFIYLAIA